MVQAAKSILISLAENPSLVGTPTLYELAVKDSGFPVIYVPAGAAESAAWERFRFKEQLARKKGEGRRA